MVTFTLPRSPPTHRSFSIQLAQFPAVLTSSFLPTQLLPVVVLAGSGFHLTGFPHPSGSQLADSQLALYCTHSRTHSRLAVSCDSCHCPSPGSGILIQSSHLLWFTPISSWLLVSWRLVTILHLCSRWLLVSDFKTSTQKSFFWLICFQVVEEWRVLLASYLPSWLPL